MKTLGFFALLAFVATASCGQTPPIAGVDSCPVDLGLADLIAASDHVVVGTMEFPIAEFRREASSESPDYMNIPVHVGQAIKGNLTGTIILRHFPRDAFYQPSNAAMEELLGRPAVLFLTQVDQGPSGLYFAGSSSQALQPAQPTSLQAVQNEVRRQAAVLRAWKVDPTVAHFAEVRSLIDKLGRVRDDEQARVFQQLEALGEPAVPAIVALMDNRRPLLDHRISLRNYAPDAFEDRRHYGPELVVDALDAILNQITSHSFGNISSGGSERERAAAVAGWRIYASGIPCGR